MWYACTLYFSECALLRMQLECQSSCAIIYQHEYHANCLNVKCSQLMKLWCDNICYKELLNLLKAQGKRPECEEHMHHDTLEPYFRNNSHYFLYLLKVVKTKVVKAKQTNVTDAKHSLSTKKRLTLTNMVKKTFFTSHYYHPTTGKKISGLLDL